MAFKVKYRTRARLQRAIQQTIRRLGLVDDGTMESSIRIGATTADLNTIYITVNAIYYYYFQDNGARLDNGGRIVPQNITAKALDTNQGKLFVSEVIEAYQLFMQDTYPILEVGDIKIEIPNMVIQYQLYGDPTGKWNGTFEEYIDLQIT